MRQRSRTRIHECVEALLSVVPRLSVALRDGITVLGVGSVGASLVEELEARFAYSRFECWSLRSATSPTPVTRQHDLVVAFGVRVTDAFLTRVRDLLSPRGVLLLGDPKQVAAVSEARIKEIDFSETLITIGYRDIQLHSLTSGGYAYQARNAIP